jgi:3-demethoxyubiquinol 3-hydroxylase
MAGRLASEGIPASSDRPSRLNVGPFNLYVPRSLKHKAEGILNEPPISDAELAARALSQAAEDSDKAWLDLSMTAAAELAPSNHRGARYLKVDHAGEHGAVHIYLGQIVVARWRCPAIVPDLERFKAHEQRHRAIFWAELQARGGRRCRSYHLCAFGGFVLGIVTGIFGPNSIAATTVAVERVVLGHLRAQIAELEMIDPLATAAISAIVRDEQSHHDEGLRLIGVVSRWTRLLMPIVGASTNAVIWLGMHL